MFRIEFFCDDRRLAEALHRLTGVAHGPPVATPVVNVVKRGKKLVPKTNGDLSTMLVEWAKANGHNQLSSKEAREFCTSIGKDTHKYGYVLKLGVRAGVLKKTGKGTGSLYVVKS